MAPSTIRDVAKAAGVGVGTVSRVLNNSEAVSEATRRKVLAAIDELDYSPNLAARRLSTGRTMTIGVILPFFTNPSYVERLRGVESVLAPSDYDLVLFNAETAVRRDAFFRDLSRRERVDGLLVISHTPSNQDVERFLRSAVPVVLIDARHPELSRVVVDDVMGGYQATRHLIDLGHRKIGFISDFLESELNVISVGDRYLGYMQALEEADISFRPAYHRQGPHNRHAARALTHELLSLAEPPTAIFAYSDTQALGVLEAARERGLDVPQKLSVVGFDDMEAAEYWRLTTIHQPLFELGLCGCELLLEEMAAGSRPEPQELVLPTELVVRSTTAPPAC